MYARCGARSASTANMKLWTAECPWFESTISAVILAKWVLKSTVLFTSSLTNPSAETPELRAARSNRQAARSGNFRVMVKEMKVLIYQNKRGKTRNAAQQRKAAVPLYIGKDDASFSPTWWRDHSLSAASRASEASSLWFGWMCVR